MAQQPVRRLRVKRYAARLIDATLYSAYRMRVEVVEADNMDTRVFVYRRDPTNPYTNDVLDTFFSIASPVDMEEYPPEQPDPNKAFQFFRRSFVELDFRSTATAMDAWQIIVKELTVLVEAFGRLSDLEEVEDFWIGPYPPDPFHGSASISEPVYQE